MTVDAERMFRDAVDEPAEPPPPEPVEPQDDGSGWHQCQIAALVVMPDGSVSAHRWAGTLLVCWFSVATAVTVYHVCNWLWSALTMPSVLLGGLWVGIVSLGVVATWLLIASVIGMVQLWRRQGQP